MKKIFLIVFTLIIIILLTFFIKPNKEKNTIKISEVTHSVFYAPLYVALENEYFKNENLNIELILTPGADKVATSVLSNDVQIGFSGPEATIYIYNKSKQKLITFASLTKRDGQFIIGDCSQKNNFKLENLYNKTILAGRSGGMPLLMFKYALYLKGIDQNKINIDTSVDFANLTSAYLSNQGEFVNLFEPNALNIEKKNKGCVLASLGQITKTVPYTTFYAKEEYIKENKEIIKKFNKALNKGIDFVKNNNPKKIAEIIKNQFPDTDINDLELLIERYKTNDSWYDSTYVNKEDFENLIDVMIYGNTIENRMDIEDLITNEFN